MKILCILEPHPYTPELVSAEEEDFAEDEPGSLSPELTRTTEGDEVVDPEADKAELVSDIRQDDKYFKLANELQILNVDSMFIFS